MLSILTALALGTSAPIVAQPETSDAWLHPSGVRAVELTTQEGTAVVYLPLEILGGDTISGSVFWKSGSIENVTLSVEDQTVSVNGSGFTVTVPSELDSLKLVLNTPSETKTERVPFTDGVREPYSFAGSPIVTRGGVLEIVGPFDGKRANTRININGRELGVLTETPRAATVSTAGLDVGKYEATTREDYQNVLIHTFNVVKISMSKISKTRQGNSIEVTVEGLQDVAESAYPLVLLADNKSPHVKPIGNQSNIASYDLFISDVKNGIGRVSMPVQITKRGEISMQFGIASSRFRRFSD